MDTLERVARRIGTGAGAEMTLGLVMAGVILAVALVHAATDPRWPFGLVVGIALCATALLRRHHRTQTAVAGLVLFAAAGVVGALGDMPPDPLFGGGLVGLLVLGADAVRTLPPRPAVLIGVAGIGVIAVSETVGDTGFFDNRALHAMSGATAWAAALAVGVWLRYLAVRRQQTLQAVRREERLELARELHDVVAHHVTGIVVQAQAAGFTGGQDTTPLLSALGSIETAGLDTLAAIRQLVGLLRSPDDTPGVSPLPEPISRLVERFAHHGPAVDLRLPADPPVADWPPQVTNTVYRVVQEALTNITRHAPATRCVTVAIDQDPRQVRVDITDDAPGTGHSASHPSRLGGGYGLVGMRERVEALGGRLLAGPRPSGGWAVHVSLPVPTLSRS
ncbi:sensor histidine kinase [Solihabitans fulvus]|uniref:histidine kinase n=1 Tax=Solihabitans fulvus TaxID=1892852 RepID=A0A5B2WQS1_9PSEU|nr:histidine kinase [Solihabitans fulvus]KAA2252876.1 sensor histidine kinase [Solihabitans fulvus]